MVKYKIISDGEHVYTVITTKTKLSIEDVNSKQILSVKYKKLFKGEKNTSLLAHIRRKQYLFISRVIYKFTANEEIKHYIAPMHNAGGPYPTATSLNYLYFFLDLEYININDLTAAQKTPLKKKSADLYKFYYNLHNRDKYTLSFKKIIIITGKNYI